MNKLVAAGFFIIFAVVLIFAYGYLPDWIATNSFYNDLINGIFILGISVSFITAVIVMARE